jgi:hypothetical protein
MPHWTESDFDRHELLQKKISPLSSAASRKTSSQSEADIYVRSCSSRFATAASTIINLSDKRVPT